MSPSRREAPRQVVDWTGEYKLDDAPLTIWRPCRLVDISTAGTGLELIGATPEQAFGRSVTLAVKLQGTVRSVSGTAHGSTRLGMQFVELTPTERAFLQSFALPRQAGER